MKISKSEILSLFINNINQFVFWKDRDSVYQGCNKNFAHYGGFDTPEEVIGKTDFEMAWSKEEAEFFIKVDKEVIESGKPQLNFEERQTLSNGSTRWISTSKVPIYDDDKMEIVGILGWYIDITPYKTMQYQIEEKDETLIAYSQRLEKGAKELEKANSDMELFTYAVSHDLKSPISNIVNFTELILKTNSDILNDEIKEQLRFVLDSGKGMNNLVEDILTFACTGSKERTAELVNIRDLVSEKLQNLDQTVLMKNAKVSIDLPDADIYCYPNLLGMVFYNIIGNGLKYNDSPTPFVNVTMEDTLTDAIFTIRDNGLGIDPDKKKSVFEPFKRLDASKSKGSGLGLSICKRIVEIHNGNIWVDSTNESGTELKFKISKNI